jgi:cellulose synthase/poly-beta-1,6-N-acetylglucosamine synthase-like glycosyltransferase
LEFSLIDDGPTDDSVDLVRSWTENRKGARLVRLASNPGKASALNRALARVTGVDLVVVFDAGRRPRRDALREWLAPFSDERVHAVSGYCRPGVTRVEGPVAAYASLEAPRTSRFHSPYPPPEV